jgi:hypothetical protein
MTTKISFILISILASGLAGTSLAAPYEDKGGFSAPSTSFDSSQLSKKADDASYDDFAGLEIAYKSLPKAEPFVPAGTCALRCGGPSDAQCFCDEACETYGDCCADKVEVCDDYTTELRGAGQGGQSVTITDLDGHADTPPDADLQKRLRAWRNFIMLLARIGDWSRDSLGLNGLYDGRVSGGVGGSTGAALDLVHANGEVSGYGFALQRSLVIDAGSWCGGSIEVPVSIFPVTASQGRSNFSATGNLTRNLLVAGFLPVQAAIGYDLELDPNDLETLTAELLLDLPWPCSDTRLYGVFQRRPL